MVDMQENQTKPFTLCVWGVYKCLFVSVGVSVDAFVCIPISILGSTCGVVANVLN